MGSEEYSRTWNTYKKAAIGGLILGVIVLYFRFLKESDELVRSEQEGFEAADNNTEKIKSILKRVDSEQQRKESVKNVRFMANEAADKWSLFAFADTITSTIRTNTARVFSESLRIFVAPCIHRIERIFHSGSR